jgi:hypothetical protein
MGRDERMPYDPAAADPEIIGSFDFDDYARLVGCQGTEGDRASRRC